MVISFLADLGQSGFFKMKLSKQQREDLAAIYLQNRILKNNYKPKYLWKTKKTSTQNLPNS